MLITKRNSKSKKIKFIEKENQCNGSDPETIPEIDSFVITKTDIRYIHLNSREFFNMKGHVKIQYYVEIILNSYDRYVLFYEEDKPPFFRKLLTTFYPEIVEKQSEDLV